jgi:CBS domain containing-hemolysin-like protein
MSSGLIWLLLNFLSIIVLAFFSMSEMACVSFNKVRLQYYVAKGNKKAIELTEILRNPSYLFGATLIGVNIALVFGSEFAREFYSSIGLSPDWAPLTQVILVVIFGELAPMFAARIYNEHVALLGISFLTFWAKLMSPILWVINIMTRGINKLLGVKDDFNENFFLTQEELQKILEQGEEEQYREKGFNTFVSNIFMLRGKTAQMVMSPIHSIAMIPSSFTVGEMRTLLSQVSHPFLPVFHRITTNIIGVAYPRDFVREPDNRRVKENIKLPWFITVKTPVLQILKQFRRNNQTISIVLDDKGQAIGILTLEDIIDEIFGNTNLGYDSSRTIKKEHLLIVDKTFPADTKVSEINKLYNVLLDKDENETLAELLVKTLGHHPEEGESIYITPFELIVKETSLLEIKSITLKSKLI